MPPSAARLRKCFLPTSKTPVKSRCRLMVAALLTAVSIAPLDANAQSDSRPLFTWRDGVLAGGFIVGTLAIHPLDKSAANVLQNPDRQRSEMYRKSANFVRWVAQPGS